MKKTFAYILFSLFTHSVFAQLTMSEAAAARDSVIAQWRKEVINANGAEMNTGTLTYDGLKMQVAGRLYGQKPDGGYPLYISMHGGGSAPKELNDQQWHNQLMLYTPQCGYYVAPRAPWDDWNMWFKPGIDELFEKLISTLVAGGMVNPNKVYVMGYSAGGDGVWRLAPRLADHWAAASMMAGHPGNVQLVNLVNTPLSVWCGALDAAYNRNEECAKKGKELDSLAAAMPGSYVHDVNIVDGKEHWMDQVDTLAVDWMAGYTRNPYPKTIVWRQEEVVRPRFYNISVSPEDAKMGMEVRMSINGNTVDLTTNDYSTLTLWFNDQLVNLDKPVTVRLNGKKVFKGKLLRTKANLEESIHLYQDPCFAYPAKVNIKN